ncbi:MAG: 16S rRNA (uracil(1498)-N(3))-methyltransferase [Planctomycetia bacterium]|nr:16S rRNA (uracil(1498)-N(3))-methyltransferase [Planctomycetia bacterium]
MGHRYYVETPIAGRQATLLGAEAHHLVHVMRATPGKRVVVFDGSGGEFVAEVERVDRGSVQLALLSQQEIDREAKLDVVAGVSLPKGERQRWLVEKLVELGVRRFVPLVTERGVAQPAAAAIERLRRAVIEGSKQCGRNRLMEIATPARWRDYVRDAASDGCRLVACPAASATAWDAIRSAVIPPGGAFAFAVGPEGGLTDEEMATAQQAGWKAVSLAPRILRVETAAVLLAAAACLADIGDGNRQP